MFPNTNWQKSEISLVPSDAKISQILVNLQTMRFRHCWGYEHVFKFWSHRERFMSWCLQSWWPNFAAALKKCFWLQSVPFFSFPFHSPEAKQKIIRSKFKNWKSWKSLVGSKAQEKNAKQRAKLGPPHFIHSPARPFHSSAKFFKKRAQATRTVFLVRPHLEY